MFDTVIILAICVISVPLIGSFSTLVTNGQWPWQMYSVKEMISMWFAISFMICIFAFPLAWSLDRQKERFATCTEKNGVWVPSRTSQNMECIDENSWALSDLIYETGKIEVNK